MKCFPLFAACLPLLFAGCQGQRVNAQWVRRQAAAYLDTRHDADDTLRQNILAGKITRGMFPDEAVAAGGPFHYMVGDGVNMMSSIGDIRLYFDYAQNVPPAPRMPTDILWMQRGNPATNLVITLTFWNTSQFGGQEPASFRVRFDNGRANVIEMAGE